MDVFSQNRLLIRLVTGLLLMNLMMLAFLAFREFRHPHGERKVDTEPSLKKDVSAILTESLDLNAEQEEKIRTLRSNFLEKEKELSAVIRGKRDSMNEIMFSNRSNDTTLMQLAHSVAVCEEQMEWLRIEQARALRSVCTQEQQAKFENLVREIRDYFKPENKKRRKKE